MKALGLLKITLLFLALGLATQIAGCAELAEALKDSKDKGQVKPQENTKALVQTDLREMREGAGTESVPTDDIRKLRLFTRIFSGETGRDVRKYVDDRIVHYFDEGDMNGLQLSPSPRNTSYSNDPRQRGLASLTDEAVTAASNVGAAVFLQGAIDQNVITMILPAIQRQIPISSTRSGIMLFGPGYTATATTEDGRTFELPTEYRQATLVHEARHSDCTGGVRQADLNIARNSRNILEFVNNYSAMSCGHLHTMCPSWHEFRDLPACDRHFWGAYAVGYVFSATKRDPRSGTARDNLLRYMENDSASRLLYITKGANHVVDVEGLLNGQYGLPDMTSSGVLD